MSNKGKQIEKLLNKTSPTAPNMTNPLKIIGDGKMIDGIKNIFNYALDEGRKNGLDKGKKIGFAKGSAITLGICGAIYLLPQGVKFVKKRISEHKAHDEMGEKIYSAFSEDLAVNSNEGCVIDEKNENNEA